jgi:hypothetical protein
VSSSVRTDGLSILYDGILCLEHRQAPLMNETRSSTGGTVQKAPRHKYVVSSSLQHIIGLFSRPCYSIYIRDKIQLTIPVRQLPAKRI